MCIRDSPSLGEQIARMSQAGRRFQRPEGGPPRVVARARSRSVCGDVSGGSPVSGLNILRLESRLRGCLRRGA
eukprot:1427633-Pyramimonas_sp.AAC.1